MGDLEARHRPIEEEKNWNSPKGCSNAFSRRVEEGLPIAIVIVAIRTAIEDACPCPLIAVDRPYCPCPPYRKDAAFTPRQAPVVRASAVIAVIVSTVRTTAVIAVAVSPV